MKKIFLLSLLISFVFSSSEITSSKYSEEFLKNNVLPSLKNDYLKKYFLSCYSKLEYSEKETENNGWTIPVECNMFKYPLKSSNNKVLQIGKVNKDKIDLLKEEIKNIKQKELIGDKIEKEEIKNIKSIEIPEIKEPSLKNKKETEDKDSKVDYKNLNAKYKIYIIGIIFVSIIITLLFMRKENIKEEVKEEELEITKEENNQEENKKEENENENINIEDYVINLI